MLHGVLKLVVLQQSATVMVVLIQMCRLTLMLDLALCHLHADGETSGTVGHGLGVPPQLIIGKTEKSLRKLVCSNTFACNKSLFDLDTTSAP